MPVTSTRWRPVWRDIETGGAASARTMRHGHTATYVAGRIYLYGGRDSDKSLLPSVEILDPSARTWRQPRVRSSSPPPRVFHTANALQESRVMVFGGSGTPDDDGKPTFFNDVWLFIIDRAEWELCSVAGEPPAPRAAHASVLLCSSRTTPSLIIFGGTDGARPMGDTWIMSIATARWETLATRGPKPPPRCYHTAALAGTTLMIFGGRTDRSICRPCTFLLDVTAREWTELPVSAPNAPQLGRSSHSAVVVGERVVIYGGKQVVTAFGKQQH